MSATGMHETISFDTINLRVKSGGGHSLRGLCADLFLVVKSVTEQEDLGNPDMFRQSVEHHIDVYRTTCTNAGVDRAESEEALYAVVALIDESVMRSSGACRNEWMLRPLQLQLFGELQAGEKFYSRLADLMQAFPTKRELLEVYYVCLCMGFAGKYAFAGDTTREQLIQQISGMLFKDEDVPRCKTARAPVRQPRSAMSNQRFYMILASALIGVLVLVWLITWGLLSFQARSLFQSAGVDFSMPGVYTQQYWCAKT